MGEMIDRIRRQNRAYDALRWTSPDTRFILFISPMLLAIVGDMILVFMWELPSFLHIVSLLATAAWRLIGTVVILHHRT